MRRVLLLLLVSSSVSCSTGGDADASGAEPALAGASGGAGCAAAASNDGPWTGATGALAYARGREIHLVDADGGNDRTIWTTPATEPGYTVTGLAWRPDGGEIAFASDHEMALSYYQRDIYAVRPDGTGLRKLTNAPAHDQLHGCPTGRVTLTVTNGGTEGGPYIVYVTGAHEPQSVLVPAGESKTITFPRVADLGATEQLAVATFGQYRWTGVAAADVQPGKSVDAGELIVTATGGVQTLGAESPFWRADGSRLGFFTTPACLVKQVPRRPPPGLSFDPLLDPAVFRSTCAVDWAPTAAPANQLLVAETDFGAGEGRIFRIREGSTDRGQPLVTYQSYELISDMRWLPDASGFIVAKRTALFDESHNLFEYAFATRQLRKLTSLTGEFARRFTVSPDGQWIAFERAKALHEGPADLWVVRRDGSDQRLLVRNAEYPAWNPR